MFRECGKGLRYTLSMCIRLVQRMENWKCGDWLNKECGVERLRIGVYAGLLLRSDVKGSDVGVGGLGGKVR